MNAPRDPAQHVDGADAAAIAPEPVAAAVAETEGSASVPTGARRRTVLLVLAIVVTVVAWASAFVVIRGVASEIGGGGLALGRLLIGTLALAVLVLLQRNWVRPNRREWLLLLFYGITWFAVYNVALNLAEATLDAGTTSMIVNIGPILIALGAGLILGEGVPRWLVIGALVAFAGVVVIGVGSGLHGGVGAEAGQPIDLAGVLWALLAAVTYATGVLAQKPVLRRLPGGQVTFLGCAIGFVACLPFSGSLIADVATASPGALLGVAYLGLVPTALAFTTWAYALSRVPAGQLGVSTYIVPPLAVLMSWAAFGEIPAALAVVGGAICLLGVALSRRRPRIR